MKFSLASNMNWDSWYSADLFRSYVSDRKLCPHSSKKFKFNKDQTEIPINVGFAGIVRNLGFILDSDLSVKQHIIKTCKPAYVQIRHISCLRQYRTRDATTTLVNSCILHSLLAGYLSTNSHQTTPTITGLLRQTRSYIL